MSSKAVVLIEDEPSIVDTIRYALTTEGFRVTTCGTGADGLRATRETGPALVILDIGLPDGSGFEFFRTMRGFYGGPVIFLTARSDEIDRVSGLEMGADDYVTKPFSPRELVARVRAVLRRGESQKSARAVKEYGPFKIDRERFTLVFKGEPVELTRYEFRLVSLLIENPGRVFSREQLMDRVWESPEMSLERTVDTHVKTIRQKLKEIDSEDNPIITHRGIGYAFKEY